MPTSIQTCQYNTEKIGHVENKIPDVSGLVNTAVFNTKTSEVENKIPNVSGFATTTVLTAVKNTITTVNDVHKK